MSFKRRYFWFGVVAAIASLVSLYIKMRNKKRAAVLPIHASESGTVHLSAASLEQMVFQMLDDMRNVRPLRVTACLGRNEAVKIAGTIQLRQSRFTPSIQEIEDKIRTNLADWAGIELPAAALHLETTLK